jgi:RNA polymerase primary sigma factor
MVSVPIDDLTLRTYLQDVAAVDVLSVDEEQALAKRIAKGDRRARDLFVSANTRLVITIAGSYRGRAAALGVPFADVVQDGNLGLLQAVDRFDYRRNLRFSTYATWWIRHVIGRHLTDTESVIRRPVHLHESRYKVQRARTRLTASLGRPPTLDELTLATGLSSRTVARALEIIQPMSLSQPLGEDGALEDLIAKPEAHGFDHGLEVESEWERVAPLLDELAPMIRTVLRRRFGFEEVSTLSEVGEQFGLSRERIRQLQNEGLSILRRRLTGKSCLPPGLRVKVKAMERRMPKRERKYVKINGLSEAALEAIREGVRNGASGYEIRRRLLAEFPGSMPSASALRKYMDRMILTGEVNERGDRHMDPRDARSAPEPGPPSLAPAPEPGPPAPAPVTTLAIVPSQRYVVRLDGSIETYDAQSALTLARLIKYEHAG